MQSGECYHITLVHGTFARNAPWTMPGSVLRQYLRQQLAGKIKFHRFRWSGWPSHTARDRASKRLRDELSYRIKKYPEAQHCVIAHSHGGNIACYAARDPEIAEHLHIVTLSTPFLIPRRRVLSLWGILSLGGTLLTLIFGTYLYVIHRLYGPATFQQFRTFYIQLYDHPYGRASWTVAATLSILIGIIYGAGWLIGPWYKWLSETLILPQLRSDRLFIVRPLADEPNRLLGAAGLLETIVTLFWGHSGGFDRLLLHTVEWGKRQADRPLFEKVWKLLSVWYFCCMGALFLATPVLWYLYFAKRHAYMTFFFGPYSHAVKVAWAWISVVFFPFMLMLAGGALMLAVLVVAGTTIGVIVTAAIFCLALIMLVVVPELGPIAMGLAVSSESSPSGTFQVLNITPPEYKLGAIEVMMHSATYTHPVALEAIAKFLATKSATSAKAAGVS